MIKPGVAVIMEGNPQLQKTKTSRHEFGYRENKTEIISSKCSAID